MEQSRSLLTVLEAHPTKHLKADLADATRGAKALMVFRDLMDVAQALKAWGQALKIMWASLEDPRDHVFFPHTLFECGTHGFGKIVGGQTQGLCQLTSLGYS